MEQNFPKSCRLRKTWEYQLVWKMGCKQHTPHFILLCRKNPAGQSRLGVTVSRKVGNAVARNRVKRRIKEFFRLHQQQFTEAVDFSVIAKKGAAVLSTEQIHAELRQVFR